MISIGDSKSRFLHMIVPAVVLAFSFLCVGLFHETHSGVFSAALSVVILVTAIKRKKLRLYVNFSSVTIMTVVLMYGLSAVWVQDKGEALIGFVKFLPALLFLILYMQYDDPGEKIKPLIPHFASVSVVLSAVLMQIPALRDYFSVAGRLSGFFEYPNTFAIFSLIALLMVINSDEYRFYSFIEIPVLLFGILYSGSRFVFALTVVSVIAVIIVNRRKKKIFLVIPAVGIPIAGVIGFAAITGRIEAISRFLTTSFGASTFVGRTLYWSDALPVILRRPFGSGYLSYFLTQSNFQKGVYSVRYMHNDILQLAFDIGWIPALMFTCFMIRHIFKKKRSAGERIVLSAFFIHMLFDFDLQFAAMFLLLIVLTDDRSGREVFLKNPIVTKGPYVVLAAFSAFMTLPLSLSLAGNKSLSYKIFPYNTENNIALMYSADAAEKEEAADAVIEQNNEVASAHSVKAACFFSRGDLANVIKYGKEGLKLAPYVYDEYSALSYMIIYGEYLYEENADEYGATYCKKALLDVKEMFESAKAELNPRAKMIKDVFPETLPEDIENYISMIDIKTD